MWGKGEIRDYSVQFEFRFSYGSYKYKGGKQEYNLLFEKIFRYLNEVFETLLEYKKYDKDTAFISYEFYEKGKHPLNSKRKIDLSFSTRKATDGKISYFVSLAFTYYPNR